MSARWPRCTPSKFPIVAAHRPRARCKEPCVTTMDAVKTLNYSVFMKNIEEQMSFYAAYHQDARNRATHFIGVPAIMLSLFIPLAWIRLEIGGVTLTAAMLFAAVVMVYYFLLDVPLALGMLAVSAVLVFIGQKIADQGTLHGWLWFGVLFIGGWILQLVGHVFEGRKPALADNLFQIFVAPIFLAAEVFFALGYKPGLHAAMQERARRMRAAT
ncbi:MAG TPA: Mpo1-like protein [Burkholderiales bacterium]|nr:Mpo1-like protein [Burkholderiales bacterium]